MEKGTFVGVGLYSATSGINMLGLVVEGGMRIPHRSVRVRVAAAFGYASPDPIPGSGGEFIRGTAGVEAPWCPGQHYICLFAGLEAGYLTAHHYSVGDARAVVIGPRFGIDAGNEMLRLRFAIDTFAGVESTEHDLRLGAGAAAMLGLVLRL